MDKTNQWLTLAANLGVIAGLVFLGYEIRQNTNIAKASAYRDNIQDIAEWRELIISDAEVARLWATYVREGFEALNETERSRIFAMAYNVMGSYENAYFARRYGIIGDEEWMRFQAGACRQFRTAVKNKFPLRYTTPGFREFLDENCKSEPAS